MNKSLIMNYLLASLVYLSPVICVAQCPLHGPQKVVIDSKHKRLLISNANGGGDLVQIDSLGNQDCFVQDADFIDGLEVVGDTVFGVGNNRKVYGYNLSDTQLVINITIPGVASKYLSSITYDSAGHLYISCPSLNEIYKLRISDQAVWVFASGNGLIKPNGILLEKEKNRLVVIGDAPYNAKIFAISLADSSVSVLMTTTFSSPDGIVRDKFGTHYVGGFDLQGLYKIDSSFSQTPVMCYAGSHMIYPTYDISDHSLLVTHYNANTWERVYLETLGIETNRPSEGFSLNPVSPNPFNAYAEISYELKNRVHVSLVVYNSFGILVKTLVDEGEDAGMHTIVWDGKNSSGKSLANGLYYIRITADGISKSQKVFLVN